MIDRKREKGFMCSYITHTHSSIIDRKRENGLGAFHEQVPKMSFLKNGTMINSVTIWY